MNGLFHIYILSLFQKFEFSQLIIQFTFLIMIKGLTGQPTELQTLNGN